MNEEANFFENSKKNGGDQVGSGGRVGGSGWMFL